MPDTSNLSCEITSLNQLVSLNISAAVEAGDHSGFGRSPAVEITNYDELMFICGIPQLKSFTVPQLPYVSSLKPQDYLIFGSSSDSKENLRKISYDDLSSEIYSEFASSCNFGSMAFEDERDYAKAEHNHNGTYNNLTAFRTQDDNNDALATIKMTTANGVATTQKLTYNAAPVKPIAPGTLKYTLFPKYTQKEILSRLREYQTADEFDGWMYPDGTTLTPEDCPGISASIFKNGNFVLPTIEGFFKGAGSNNKDSVKSLGLPGVAEHYHDIGEIDIGSSLNGTAVIPVSKLVAAGACAHCGTIKNGKPDAQFTVNAKLESNSLAYINNFTASGENIESDDDIPYSYPSHNKIAVMIYVKKS